MVNLENKYIKLLKEIISKYLVNYQLYLYGSRAKGTARRFSDVDIAINSLELNSLILSKIKFDIEESTIPYSVDILDYNCISDDFKNIISSSLIQL